MMNTPLKLLWVYCPGHAGVKGNDWADTLVDKATLTNDLLLRRSEVLRSLRYYLQVQSHGHHTIDHLEERGMERGSARQSLLKGWERAIANQTNTGSASLRTLGKLLRDRVECTGTILNWTQLKWRACWLTQAAELSTGGQGCSQAVYMHIQAPPWSSSTSFPSVAFETALSVHMGFSKCTDTILNWTEMMSTMTHSGSWVERRQPGKQPGGEWFPDPSCSPAWSPAGTSQGRWKVATGWCDLTACPAGQLRAWWDRRWRASPSRWRSRRWWTSSEVLLLGHAALVTSQTTHDLHTFIITIIAGT